MKERTITHPPGQGAQPQRYCPECGAAVVKGVKPDIGLAYICNGYMRHYGHWDHALRNLENTMPAEDYRLSDAAKAVIDRNNGLGNRVKELEDALAAKQVDYDKLRANYSLLVDEARQLRIDAEAARAELNDAQRRIAELTELRDALAARRDTYKARVTALEDQLADLGKTVTTLNETLEACIAERDTLRKHRDELTEDLGSNEDRMQQLQREVDMLRAQAKR